MGSTEDSSPDLRRTGALAAWIVHADLSSVRRMKIESEKISLP